MHFTLQEGGELIGAARISYLKRLDELKYPTEVFGDVGLPDGEPFVFYSRLVVHPNHQGRGIGNQFDVVRMTHIAQSGVKWVLGTCRYRRKERFKELGFDEIKTFPEEKLAEFGLGEGCTVIVKRPRT